MDKMDVVFRKWGKKNGGGVIAMLVQCDVNRGNIMCYEHVGQHGEGSPWGVIEQTKLATPEEYADLLQELHIIYETNQWNDEPVLELVIRKKINYNELRKYWH